MPGYKVEVAWDQPEDTFGGAVGPYNGQTFIRVHPYTFCKMYAEFYGYIKALDVLKKFLHMRIDNLFKAERVKLIQKRERYLLNEKNESNI